MQENVNHPSPVTLSWPRFAGSASRSCAGLRGASRRSSLVHVGGSRRPRSSGTFEDWKAFAGLFTWGTYSVSSLPIDYMALCGRAGLPKSIRDVRSFRIVEFHELEFKNSDIEQAREDTWAFFVETAERNDDFQGATQQPAE